MKESNTIKTIREFSETEYKEKGSRFIARAYPASNEQEVSNYLNESKKKYFDASHYCFAYRFQNEKIRYSDAGEPSGTAGIRILNAIDHFELTNVLLIVIRYFGGTKLGTGPLGKAYYTSALLVLEKAKVLTESLFSRICVRIDFNFLPGLLRIMARKEMGVSDIRYKNSFEIEFLIRHEQVEIFKNKLNNLTKGTATIKIFENIYQ